MCEWYCVRVCICWGEEGEVEKHCRSGVWFTYLGYFILRFASWNLTFKQEPVNVCHECLSFYKFPYILDVCFQVNIRCKVYISYMNSFLLLFMLNWRWYESICKTQLYRIDSLSTLDSTSHWHFWFISFLDLEFNFWTSNV